MSSFPGHTLEDFADDLFIFRDAEQHAREVADYVREVADYVREYIEGKMEDYDEGTQSWRDYRNSLAETIDGIRKEDRRREEAGEITRQAGQFLHSREALFVQPGDGESIGIYIFAAKGAQRAYDEWYETPDPEYAPSPYSAGHGFTAKFEVGSGAYVVGWRGHGGGRNIERFLMLQACVRVYEGNVLRKHGSCGDIWAPTQENLTSAGRALWRLIERANPDCDMGLLVTFET